jgi:hypothetical protein
MQEVIQEQKENEVVFDILPKKKLKCPKCNRMLNTNCFVFNRVLKESVCHQCNKKIGTNPFYNQNYGKKNNFVGIKNLSTQEYRMLIKKYTDRGMCYNLAKNRVDYDLSIVRHQKVKKVEPQATSVQNLAIRKIDRTKTKELIKGLGLK